MAARSPEEGVGESRSVGSPVPSAKTVVAKMAQLRALQQMATPQSPGTPSEDRSRSVPAGKEPPALPVAQQVGRPASPAVSAAGLEEEEEERALAAKIVAVQDRRAGVAARLGKAREELASSSREESNAFVDVLAARAAENAAAAVRAAAAEAETSAESEAMRQIAVFELQLEQSRVELQLEKLRSSESTDAVIKRLHAEQDQALALVNSQAAERQKAAVERARLEMEALNKDALAAAKRAYEEELAQERARWEEESEERLQAAVHKVQLEADAKIAEATSAYRTGSSTTRKEEAKRLRAEFEERLEASKAAALVLAKEETRQQLDELREDFETEREEMEAKHAEELRTRVAAAERHALLDAEQRYSEERAALRAEKQAAVNVVRQQAAQEFAEKLQLKVQQAKWDLEDKNQAESQAQVEPRLLRERKARRAAEAELRRATTYLEGVQSALAEQQQATAVASEAALSGLDRDGKEAKIEAMIARRLGAEKRNVFAGWRDVVVMRKLDKGAIEWVMRRFRTQRLHEMFDRWFDYNLALQEAASEAAGGPKRTITAAF